MHKIFELKEMELDQLRTLASDLQVKGYKRMEKDDLIYAIIDAEAIKTAQAAPEKPAKQKGRPRKDGQKPVQKPAVKAAPAKKPVVKAAPEKQSVAVKQAPEKQSVAVKQAPAQKTTPAK